VVAEKARFILLGRYPADEAWRPIARRRADRRQLAGVAFGCCAGLGAGSPCPARRMPLLGGGVGGLGVPTELWGGLPLTLLLTAAGMAGALPWASPWPTDGARHCRCCAACSPPTWNWPGAFR
jgi:general L-amino acid transport system permease protein